MCFIRIYSDIRLVHSVASEYIRIFVRVHFIIFAHHCSVTQGLVSGITSHFLTKKIVCERYLSILSPSLCKKHTHMRQELWVTYFIKKICIFSKKIGYSFHKVLETLPFPFFPIFLIPILNYIVFLFVCMLHNILCKEIAIRYIYCPNQNIDKNLEKLQFWPRFAGHWDLRFF